MKYALRNIVRIPHRTLLVMVILFCVFFMLMWSTLTALLCSSAIDSEIGVLNGAVQITDGNTAAPTGKTPLSLDRLKYIDENFDIITDIAAYYETTCDSAGMNPLIGSEDNSIALNLGYLTFPIYATSEMNILDSMMSGNIKIESGTGITAEDHKILKCKIVISDTLAKLNSLSLGDTIELRFVYNDGYKNSMKSRNFVIGGIYEILEKPANEERYSYQIAENTLYIPLATYEALTGQTNIKPTNAWFQLEHSSETTVDMLETRLNEVGYPEVKLLLYTPESITGGIARLLTLVRLAAILLVGCGIAAFIVTIFMNLHARVRELGILTALGKPSALTVRDFFAEIMIIAFLALIISRVLFYAGAQIGSDFIIDFISSDTMATEHVNTTSETVLNMAADKSSPDMMGYLSVSLFSAFCVALGVILLSYIMIWQYLKRLDIPKVLGGGVE